MKQATAYCLSWHLKNSDAFRDLIEAPLKSYMDVNFIGWDGESLPRKPAKGSTLIFCMLPPDQLTLQQKDLNLIWVPMWDQAQGYNDEWWAALPKHLKVLAFSDVIFHKAKQANLSVLRLRYFKNPESLTPTNWENGRIAYYWNRVGMIGPEFLEKFCKEANISELLFNPDVDPGIEENKYYELPAKIGNTRVTTIHRTKTREGALQQIERANIVISPRMTEGAGMVFLEAMARGCAVVAHDAPTMNEYIKDCDNGILLDDTWLGLADRIKMKLGMSSSYKKTGPYLLNPTIDWKKITSTPFEKLGTEAAELSLLGYKSWMRESNQLASFIDAL